MTGLLARAVGVSRRFGDTLALDRADLDIPQGGIVGLLGPNGAGKSTMISLLTGLRRPSAGRVELFGGDPRNPASRRRLGTTPQRTGLPENLRVGEVVDFVGAHYADPVPTGELLDRFGLTALRRRQTGALSGGQQRLLTVALAVVGRPALVVLDEPTTGLDVDARLQLWDALRDYHATGGTLLLTSHYLEEVEALAERVVVIAGGRVLVDDTLDAVRSRVPTRRLLLRAAHLPALDGVLDQAVLPDGRTELLTNDSDALVRELVLSEAEFTDLEVSGASLEEAFRSLTGRRDDESLVPTSTTTGAA
ncbi:ABC transporter ATP-binding protein [Actinoalloteichus sp. AHMU CJ021]|uniref:ABC-2 type transport system ATP-binding protein n=1 Tax=Actinoalloteichus caeruleus DSM 43889 TaxID=1120930 RepID=A0ABT1JMN0_ACTCY|nr:ABC transporter ATP-binding protein [Actinoalloteichus caeruleus]AUS79323.1 ABC transporter ATP-binding protein [Actinoalloteichus sp. AHMU CJ021]MCP2333602.1 ABC-2 type transport system ATP-binding protein [Actinoalloteichus caeruleus DSM 43889]